MSINRPSPEILLEKLQKDNIADLPLIDRVVWQYEFEPTIIQSELVDDPLIAGFRNYFNSHFFRSVPKKRSPEAVKKFKNSFEQLLIVVANTDGTNTNTLFDFKSSVLKNIGNNSLYTYWTHLRPVLNILAFNPNTLKRNGINSLKLQEIISHDSRQVATLLKNKRNYPTDIKRAIGSKRGDLFANLEDPKETSPLELMTSLRLFCSHVIIEWATIRNKLYSTCPETMKSLLNYKKDYPINDNRYNTANIAPTKWSKYSSMQFHQQIFELAEKINHPFLTEFLISHYLRICTAKKFDRPNLPKAIADIWNTQNMSSVSNGLNLFENVLYKYKFSEELVLKINEEQHEDECLLQASKRRKLTDEDRENIVHALDAGATAKELMQQYNISSATVFRQKELLNNQRFLTSPYATRRNKDIGTYLINTYGKRTRFIEKEWLIKPELRSNQASTVGGLGSIEDFIGVTAIEELCFYWLLASDRHQPSNIAQFCTIDLEETSNSISTVINPQSLKGRNMTVSGTPYIEGSMYLNNSNSIVFKALSLYKQQIERSYKLKVFMQWGNSNLKPMLPTISTEYRDKWQVGGHYYSMKTNTIYQSPMALILMHGSQSNEHLNNLIKGTCAFSNHLRSLFIKSESSSGTYTVPADEVCQLAVYTQSGSPTKDKEITISSNNEPLVYSEELEFQEEIIAREHNHSPSTRSNQYLNKAPDWFYTADDRRFGQKVGDAMISWSIPIAEELIQNTQVLTPAKVRELLGIETNEDIEARETETGLSLKQAKALGYLIDEIGIASKGSKKLIIRTPTTAALINAKIKHIDANIGRLYADEKSRPKAELLTAHRMYLRMLIELSFTKSELREAEEKYGDNYFRMNDVLA